MEKPIIKKREIAVVDMQHQENASKLKDYTKRNM